MSLEERYRKAIQELGGAEGLLRLPEPMKKLLKDAKDLKEKVELMELIAYGFRG